MRKLHANLFHIISSISRQATSHSVDTADTIPNDGMWSTRFLTAESTRTHTVYWLALSTGGSGCDIRGIIKLLGRRPEAGAQ